MEHATVCHQGLESGGAATAKSGVSQCLSRLQWRRSEASAAMKKVICSGRHGQGCGCHVRSLAAGRAARHWAGAGAEQLSRPGRSCRKQKEWRRENGSGHWAGVQVAVKGGARSGLLAVHGCRRCSGSGEAGRRPTPAGWPAVSSLKVCGLGVDGDARRHHKPGRQHRALQPGQAGRTAGRRQALHRAPASRAASCTPRPPYNVTAARQAGERAPAATPLSLAAGSPAAAPCRRGWASS